MQNAAWTPGGDPPEWAPVLAMVHAAIAIGLLVGASVAPFLGFALFVVFERPDQIPHAPGPTVTYAAPAPPPAPALSADGTLDGYSLMEGSDCLACHKQDVQLVGPSFAAIAEKYRDAKDAVPFLAEKVIAGGAGNWGQVPMSPHPQISQEHAEAMVSWILEQ